MQLFTYFAATAVTVVDVLSEYVRKFAASFVTVTPVEMKLVERFVSRQKRKYLYQPTTSHHNKYNVFELAALTKT